MFDGLDKYSCFKDGKGRETWDVELSQINLRRVADEVQGEIRTALIKGEMIPVAIRFTQKWPSSNWNKRYDTREVTAFLGDKLVNREGSVFVRVIPQGNDLRSQTALDIAWDADEVLRLMTFSDAKRFHQRLGHRIFMTQARIEGKNEIFIKNICTDVLCDPRKFTHAYSA